ncbi:MAG: hypothetical protein ACE5HY_04770 [Candidatus Hydrothermarchaeales archaeon]
MSKVTVDAGICGFTAIIKAKKKGKNKVRVEIFCPCEMIKEMDTELRGIEVSSNAFLKICDSVVYRLASKHIKHTACPVPAAILKAVEVEMGLALPKDVTMKIAE